MKTPTPHAAQLIIASAFVKHARANHPMPFGDCHNPECLRGYRLLMRLWPDTADWFDSPPNKATEEARFEIASKIDAALPNVCWVSLAGRALGCHVIQDTECSTQCGSDEAFKKRGSCYCGKHMTAELRSEIESEQKEAMA